MTTIYAALFLISAFIVTTGGAAIFTASERRDLTGRFTGAILCITGSGAIGLAIPMLAA